MVTYSLPNKISITCSLFLRRGGAIHCTVTGPKRCPADLEQGGLEVPGDGKILSLEVADNKAILRLEQLVLTVRVIR